MLATHIPVAVDISLYPLDSDFIPPIKDFIERLSSCPEIEVGNQSDEYAGARRVRDRHGRA